MAAQQRVQAYLEKHKISALFEELMAKVINSTPTDPLVYLCTVLERKVEKRKMMGSRGISPMRKSASDIDGKMRGTAGAWATTSMDGGMAVVKERGVTYDKPWLANTNTKRTRPKTAEEGARPPRQSRSPARPDWNKDTKLAGKDFDEMFTSQPRRSRSPQKYTGTDKLWRSPSYEHELNYKSCGYTGPHRGEEDSGALDAELRISTGKPSRYEAKTGPTIVTIKQKGAKADAMRHRHRLNEYVNKQQRQEDSGIEDDHMIDDQEDGLDVWENLDDLKSEGVTNIKGSGIRIKSLPSKSGDPVVRVAICGRCAKIMTSSEPITYNDAATENGTKYGELPRYNSLDSQRSVQFENAPEDDEFESVSQVSGPRRPVWQDSDGFLSDDSSLCSTDLLDNIHNLRSLHFQPLTGETTTPRKGAPMFESTGVPNKGRPMYSRSEVRDSMQSIGQSSTGHPDPLMATAPAVLVRPDDGGASTARSQRSAATVPNWQRTMSEDYDERNVETPDLLTTKGRSWAIPEDSEISDAEWNGRNRFPGQKQRKGGGQF